MPTCAAPSAAHASRCRALGLMLYPVMQPGKGPGRALGAPPRLEPPMRSSYWSSESRESARSMTMNCSKLSPSRALASLVCASSIACRNAASTCARPPPALAARGAESVASCSCRRERLQNRPDTTTQRRGRAARLGRRQLGAQAGHDVVRLRYAVAIGVQLCKRAPRARQPALHVARLRGSARRSCWRITHGCAPH